MNRKNQNSIHRAMVKQAISFTSVLAIGIGVGYLLSTRAVFARKSKNLASVHSDTQSADVDAVSKVIDAFHTTNAALIVNDETINSISANIIDIACNYGLTVIQVTNDNAKQSIPQSTNKSNENENENENKNKIIIMPKHKLYDYLMSNSITILMFIASNNDFKNNILSLLTKSQSNSSKQYNFQNILLCHASKKANANNNANNADNTNVESVLITIEDLIKELNNNTLDKYFLAVQSNNVQNIIDVFDKNGNIITCNKIFSGHNDISDFYLNGILKCNQFYPESNERFFSNNGDIAVEITLHCNNVAKLVGDFFTFKNGKIKSLTVYSGRGYSP